MISQKQMNEWVPKAVEHFQSVMPPINCPYPQYKIVTDRTADSIRASLLEQTGSQAVIRSGTAAMETLHGPRGDAIIIYQKRFNSQLFRGGGEDMFRHFYWHELGHFYSLNKADPSLLRFADQKPHPDEYEALLGYAFWTEFIAEVIACKVEPDPVIDWKNFYWYTPRNTLMGCLNGAFNADNLGWYDLAFYFAKILADKMTVQFIEKARNGSFKIRRVVRVREETVTFQEAGIDPAALDSISDQFLPAIKVLQEELNALLNRKNYWEITLDDLSEIGDTLFSMERMMTMDDLQVRLGERLRDRLGL